MGYIIKLIKLLSTVERNWSIVTGQGQNLWLGIATKQKGKQEEPTDLGVGVIH